MPEGYILYTSTCSSDISKWRFQIYFLFLPPTLAETIPFRQACFSNQLVPPPTACTPENKHETQKLVVCDGLYMFLFLLFLLAVFSSEPAVCFCVCVWYGEARIIGNGILNFTSYNNNNNNNNRKWVQLPTAPLKFHIVRLGWLISRVELLNFQGVNISWQLFSNTVYYHPDPNWKWSNLTIFFLMGWFNDQLVFLLKIWLDFCKQKWNNIHNSKSQGYLEVFCSLHQPHAWRIIPISMWLGSPPFISHKKGHLEGVPQPQVLGGLLTVTNHSY